MADKSGVGISIKDPWEITSTDGQASSVNFNVKGDFKVGGRYFIYDAVTGTYKQIKSYVDGSGRNVLYWKD